MAITMRAKDIISLGTDSASSKAPDSSSRECYEKVAKKAYELYQKRGCKAGHDKEDWYEAERLVRTGKA